MAGDESISWRRPANSLGVTFLLLITFHTLFIELGLGFCFIWTSFFWIHLNLSYPSQPFTSKASATQITCIIDYAASASDLHCLSKPAATPHQLTTHCIRTLSPSLACVACNSPKKNYTTSNEEAPRGVLPSSETPAHNLTTTTTSIPTSSWCKETTSSPSSSLSSSPSWQVYPLASGDWSTWFVTATPASLPAQEAVAAPPPI